MLQKVSSSYSRDYTMTNQAYLAWGIGPGEVGKVGVNRDGYNFGVNGFKLSKSFAEGDNLSWANKSAADIYKYCQTMKKRTE